MTIKDLHAHVVKPAREATTIAQCAASGDAVIAVDCSRWAIKAFYEDAPSYLTSRGLTSRGLRHRKQPTDRPSALRPVRSKIHEMPARLASIMRVCAPRVRHPHAAQLWSGKPLWWISSSAPSQRLCAPRSAHKVRYFAYSVRLGISLLGCPVFTLG